MCTVKWWVLAVVLVAGCERSSPVNPNGTSGESVDAKLQVRATAAKASPQSSKPKIESGYAGERVAIGSLAWTVDKSGPVEEIGEKFSATKAPEGSQFYTVGISAINTGAEPRLLPSVQLFDRTGVEYSESKDRWRLKDKMPLLENINPRIERHYTLVYEVPMNFLPSHIRVSGGIGSGEQANIRLSERSN